MESSENTVRVNKVWTYWQGRVEIVLRILVIVWTFPAVVSAGVLSGTTLYISIHMQVNNAFLVPLPNALGIALAGGVLVLCYGVFGGTWQLMVLILRLRGFVTVEKIRRHFAKSIGSTIAQAVLLFMGGILAGVFSNSPNNDAIITSIHSSQLSSASSCAAFSIIGAILYGSLAGWEIALVNIWKTELYQISS